jgi:hypothetical protein
MLSNKNEPTKAVSNQSFPKVASSGPKKAETKPPISTAEVAVALRFSSTLSRALQLSILWWWLRKKPTHATRNSK